MTPESIVPRLPVSPDDNTLQRIPAEPYIHHVFTMHSPSIIHLSIYKMNLSFFSFLFSPFPFPLSLLPSPSPFSLLPSPSPFFLPYFSVIPSPLFLRCFSVLSPLFLPYFSLFPSPKPTDWPRQIQDGSVLDLRATVLTQAAASSRSDTSLEGHWPTTRSVVKYCVVVIECTL